MFAYFSMARIAQCSDDRRVSRNLRTLIGMEQKYTVEYNLRVHETDRR